MRIVLVLSMCLCSILAQADCVILLHGLARTENSMDDLEEALHEQGYRVENISYESTKYDIQTLAPASIGPALESCGQEQQVNFVTHSMGGILVTHTFMMDDDEVINQVQHFLQHGQFRRNKVEKQPG